MKQWADDEDRWLRDLLASLERPAMPDHVAARIDAALAGSAAPAVGPPAQRSGSRPAHAQSRRRRGWLVGSGVMAATVLALIALNPFGVGQQPPAGHDETLAEPSSQTVNDVAKVLTASSTAYTEQELPRQSIEVAKTAPDGAQRAEAELRRGSWAAATTMPAASTRGAAACVIAVSRPVRGQLVFVDRAAYEGQPALVVARRSGTVLEVHVLRASCTVADPAVVQRASVEMP